MKLVKDSAPTRHARHFVDRDGRYFIATPCYGMHEPWWVAMTAGGEVEPVAMHDTDRWVPLEKLEKLLELLT